MQQLVYNIKLFTVSDNDQNNFTPSFIFITLLHLKLNKTDGIIFVTFIFSNFISLAFASQIKTFYFLRILCTPKICYMTCALVLQLMTKLDN